MTAKIAIICDLRFTIYVFLHGTLDMNNPIQETRWSENVILVDADYVDKVAFNLIVNFERMLGRRIPQADIARWIDCVALDGGIREGEHETQVVLIHQKGKQGLENFAPSAYEELDGKAFKDHLGEFAINAYPIEPIAVPIWRRRPYIIRYARHSDRWMMRRSG